jgi:virulence factor Mce-like protein
VTVDFAASGGVFTDQEVTYRGVQIGRVGDLTLTDDGVSIPLVIEPEWEGEIPADVTARILSKSAVGEQYVDLSPRSAGGDMLVDGSTIARSRTRLPVDFQELLSTLDATLGDIPPDTAHRLIKNLGKGLRGKGSEIATVIRSLSTLSGAFAEVAPEQQRLLTNATQAGSAFLSSKEEFVAAIEAADKVLAGIGDEPEELRDLFASNDEFAREASALLNRRGDQIAQGIEGLADLVDFQLNNIDEVGKSLDFLPQFLHAIEDSSVPWRSPDGRYFYRIRAGLVMDNVRATWPCKYASPLHWERMPHVRDERETLLDSPCEMSTEPGANRAATDALVTALREWAETSPSEPVIEPILVDSTVPALPAGSDGVASSVGFGWPIEGTLTSPFGPRGGAMHEGIDIDGETGDPVAASAAGTVLMAGYYSGYGNAVIVDHGDGLTTLYGHLNGFAVSAGQRVAQGQTIGFVGSTGHSTGSHLHFEIRVGGLPVDPLPYLPGGTMFLLTPDVPLTALADPGLVDPAPVDPAVVGSEDAALTPPWSPEKDAGGWIHFP